jgi:hypothetical protein
VNDHVVQNVDQKVVRRHFTISEISCEFPQISRTLYETVTVRLGDHKFCATLVPKMFTGTHKTQRMTSALTFFIAIPQR